MHTWLQMKYDPKLEGLQNFLSWIESFREDVWLGSLDQIYVYQEANKGKDR